ncbi:MAG TPA: SEC-C metal-binding domain-containing protein, partial [Caulobacteraceae bacterium]|nr:SEC-C metal-binding domain-containing protein [Caulobacteraceae bacterium]
LPPKAYADQWDVEGLDERVQSIFGLVLPIKEWAAEEGIANEEIEQRILAAANARAAEREALISSEHMRGLEKNFILQMVDLQWREHLMHLDHLRNVIGLRGYGQRDPLNEYKVEAFSLFENLRGDLRQNVTRWLMTVEIQFTEPEPPPQQDFIEVHVDPTTGENERALAGLGGGGDFSAVSTEQRAALPMSALPDGWDRTGRNHPCPCGSGRKFKHCHGQLV